MHTALVAAVTPVALASWTWFARPDLQALLEMYLPPIPVALLWVGAVGLGLTNAILEELIWRGVLHSQLRALGGVWVAIGIGATSFGLQHPNGLPSGPPGIVLLTAWGVLLGWLRERAGGLLAPVLAHAVAELACAWLLLALLT
jgi:hypothetical protein